MPNYDYKCPKCGQIMNVWMPRFESNMEKTWCRACLIPMERQISAPSVHFQGSGFYETDYKGK